VLNPLIFFLLGCIFNGMKKKIIKGGSWLVFVLAMSLFFGCKSTENTVEEQQAFERLVEQLDKSAFRFEAEAVYPYNSAANSQVLNSILTPNTGNSAARINVQGNGHFLEISEGMVKASLPYFGEQLQGGGNYGKADVGVDLEGELLDYEFRPEQDKNRVVVEFRGQDSQTKSEKYDLIITARPNGRAEVIIISSQRTNIRYSGTLAALDKPN